MLQTIKISIQFLLINKDLSFLTKQLTDCSFIVNLGRQHDRYKTISQYQYLIDAMIGAELKIVLRKIINYNIYYNWGEPEQTPH